VLTEKNSPGIYRMPLVFGEMKFPEVFLHLNSFFIYAVWAGNAETNIRLAENLNGYLMASCVRNIHTQKH